MGQRVQNKMLRLIPSSWRSGINSPLFSGLGPEVGYRGLNEALRLDKGSIFVPENTPEGKALEAVFYFPELWQLYFLQKYRSGITDVKWGEWIPQCFGTPDDVKLGAFCASEPDAGSDVSGIRTTARYDEAKDEWVLNGQKAWATNGGIASVHVVIASVDRELGSRGHAAFVIPPGTPGCEQGAKVKKHGLRASHTADVHLDDCRIPGSCLLGGKEKLDERLARVREGKKGKSQAAMQTFEASRPTVGAQALGIARAAYEYALDYAKQREQFGRPIVENQAIAFALADMKVEIEAARLLVWRAAWMGRTGQTFDNAEGSMSKLKAGEVAVWVTERAIQILGGNGYTREFPVERMHRDSKIYTIFEGTSEIQRLVISRAISGVHIK